MRGERERVRSTNGDGSDRRSCTEVDIQALISNPAFLVAVDAYGADRCTLRQMTERAFAEPYLPRGLSIGAFTRLVIEIVRRIHARDLSVPDEWKAGYWHFYFEQPDSRRGGVG
jgi:hypothetical protein